MPDPETPKSEVKTPAPGKPRAPRQPVPKRLRRQAQTARERALAGAETPDPETVEQPEPPKRAKRQASKAKRPPGRAAKAKATDAKARRAKQRAHNAQEAARLRARPAKAQRARPAKARKTESGATRPRKQAAKTKRAASQRPLPSPRQARAQVGKRDAFFEAARPHSPYLGVVTAEGSFVMPTADRLGQGLFSKRARPEFRVLSRAVSIVEALMGEDAVVGRQFVDVGANIGTTTIPALLAHRFGSAVALEPGHDNFRTLRANIALNELEDRVRTVRVAVSNRAGSSQLVVVEGESEQGWIALEASQIKQFEKSRAKEAAALGQAASQLPPVTVSEVDLVTLDALVDEGVVDPERAGMLWIDTEGHEGHILDGAGALTERGTPVVFEFHPAGLDEHGDRQKISDVAEGRYTHFVEVRRPEVDSNGPDRKVRPATELAEYAERFLDPESPVPFTDLLLMRLDAAQASKGADLSEVVRAGERRGQGQREDFA